MTAENRLQIGAVGDLLLSGRYDSLAESGAGDSVFDGVRDAFESCDVVVGNMESPLTTSSAYKQGKLCIKGRPEYASILKNAGFDVVSLANNHILDYGIEGYRQTRECLEKAGIGCVGAGENIEQAREPLFIERKGNRLCFLGYSDESTRGFCDAGESTAGVAPLLQEMVEEDIQRWGSQSDLVVLLLHWGLEYAPYPSPEQVQMAHAFVDAGAGLILGHHSHMLQGFEEYNGSVIAYSLANFCDSDVDWTSGDTRYTDTLSDTDREGVIAVSEFDGHRVCLKSRIPLWIDDNGQPIPAVGERMQQISNKISERSQVLGIEELRRYWEQTVVNTRIMDPLKNWWENGNLWEKMRRINIGQVHSAFLLLGMYLKVKFSRSRSKWMLFNSRNDDRPMPGVRKRD